MRSALSVVAAGLLVLGPAAGCVGSGSDADDAADDPIGAAASGLVDAAGEPARRAPLRFAFEAPVHRSVWANGTFDVKDHNFPVGFAAAEVTGQRPYDHMTDISQVVPVGVPVQISMETTWQPTRDGWLQLRLYTDDAVIYTWAGDGELGHLTNEIRLTRFTSSPVLAGVRYNSPDASPTLAYTFSARIDHDPGVVLPGVPVGVTVDAAAPALFLDALDPVADSQLLLWGPHDAFLGRVPYPATNTTNVLPAGSPPGEYVVLLRQDGSAARLSAIATPSGASPVRALGLAFEFGAARALDGTGGVEWDFQVSRVPVAVAFIVDESVYARDLVASITSPEGEIVSFDFTGSDWLFSDSWFGSAVGQDGLVAGTYHASYEATVNARVEVLEAVAYHDRSPA